MGTRNSSTAPTVVLALGLFASPFLATDTIIVTAAVLVSPAVGRPGMLTKHQSDALEAYSDAVSRFRSILDQRRVQMRAVVGGEDHRPVEADEVVEPANLR